MFINKKMKKIIFIYLILIIQTGCFENEVPPPKALTGNDLKDLVIDCTHGSKQANDSLSGLIDLTLGDNIKYNSLFVDSIYLDSNKYFIVLLEYPDPVYNRFAIFDTLTNCYLIDKSLNGFLSFAVVVLNNTKILKMVERFAAKEKLALTRLSFYKKYQDNFVLIYRSFAELKTPRRQFYQTIYSISDDTIKTKISLPRRYKFDADEDVFVFNDVRGVYLSEKSSFDSLVVREIVNFKPKR